MGPGRSAWAVSWASFESLARGTERRCCSRRWRRRRVSWPRRRWVSQTAHRSREARTAVLTPHPLCWNQIDSRLATRRTSRTASWYVQTSNKDFTDCQSRVVEALIVRCTAFCMRACLTCSPPKRGDWEWVSTSPTALFLSLSLSLSLHLRPPASGPCDPSGDLVNPWGRGPDPAGPRQGQKGQDAAHARGALRPRPRGAPARPRARGGPDRREAPAPPREGQRWPQPAAPRGCGGRRGDARRGGRVGMRAEMGG